MILTFTALSSRPHYSVVPHLLTSRNCGTVRDTLRSMQIIALANLKGGSAKTTSTAFLAHAFAAQGRSVLVIDADPQGHTLRWSEAAEWDIPTLALPVKNLHNRLSGIVPPATDVVLIDTPPLEQQAGIVHSALRTAHTVVIPSAPAIIEFDRVVAMWAAIEDVEPLREEPAHVTVLLNRTVANANSTRMFSDLIRDGGHHVLTTTIPRREFIAQAWTAPITKLGYYAEAAEEIDQLGATE